MSHASRAQSRPDPRRRAFWLKHLYRWHWISSAACLIGMLLFTVTGLTLNHAAHDPRSGCPVDHGLASVTVLHPECMNADAPATALTVLGAAAGLAYARRRGLAVLFIERGPRGIEERMTPSCAARLE
jgi:hypothetical protein